MIHSDSIKIIVYIIFLMILSHGCSQSTKSANMKWISKYNFYDIYQKNINNGHFPPVTGLNLKIFKFLDENTIFLADSKYLYSFYNKSGYSAVLFISKDGGKTYKEIVFSEENIINFTLSKKYSLVETNSKGYSPMGKNVIYLFDNETFYLKKK